MIILVAMVIIISWYIGLKLGLSKVVFWGGWGGEKKSSVPLLPQTHMIQTPVMASSSLLMKFSQARELLTNSTPLELISWEPEGGRRRRNGEGQKLFLGLQLVPTPFTRLSPLYIWEALQNLNDGIDL